MKDLARFCDEWFAAWTGGDVERLVGYYADDCVYSDPTKPHGLRGKEELRRYLAKWLPQHAQMVWTRRDLYPTPGGFCVTWDARIPVAGQWIQERGMDVVLLDGAQRITRNEVYFDLAAWKAALAR